MEVQDLFQKVNANIAVAIRIHKIDTFSVFQRSLSSVLSQENVIVYPIIISQNFSEDQSYLLKEFCSYFEFLFNREIFIINYEESPGVDCRSAMLNVFLEYVRNNDFFEYFGFLDYDDVIFSRSYTVLVNSCRFAQMEVAYGGILREIMVDSGDNRFFTTRWEKGPFSLDDKRRSDLINGNFLPIHSYLVSTSVLTSSVQFDERLLRLEDYDFLLQLASFCKFSPLARKIPVGSYRFYRSSSVTNSTHHEFSPKNLDTSPWLDAMEFLLEKHGDLSLVDTFAEVHLFNASL